MLAACLDFLDSRKAFLWFIRRSRWSVQEIMPAASDERGEYEGSRPRPQKQPSKRLSITHNFPASVQNRSFTGQPMSFAFFHHSIRMRLFRPFTNGSSPIYTSST